MKFVFYPSKLKKQSFFANNFKIHGGALAPPAPPSDAHDWRQRSAWRCRFLRALSEFWTSLSEWHCHERLETSSLFRHLFWLVQWRSYSTLPSVVFHSQSGYNAMCIFGECVGVAVLPFLHYSLLLVKFLCDCETHFQWFDIHERKQMAIWPSYDNIAAVDLLSVHNLLLRCRSLTVDGITQRSTTNRTHQCEKKCTFKFLWRQYNFEGNLFSQGLQQNYNETKISIGYDENQFFIFTKVVNIQIPRSFDV